MGARLPAAAPLHRREPAGPIGGILAELDEYPLEAALQIKEAHPDREVRVSAVTVGPEGPRPP
ncbi:hypothetical protein [Nesterenkonia pannonica]|uniref:hypothetical protein n=1 Tax=Nesterenkonia pannonica TaxID=1548602 RepID=UPI00216485CB|nr:hypothetical protein [Nesterenkonia pannonica]